jgi:hypothetical protein
MNIRDLQFGLRSCCHLFDSWFDVRASKACSVCLMSTPMWKKFQFRRCCLLGGGKNFEVVFPIYLGTNGTWKSWMGKGRQAVHLETIIRFCLLNGTLQTVQRGVITREPFASDIQSSRRRSSRSSIRCWPQRRERSSLVVEMQRGSGCNDASIRKKQMLLKPVNR